MCLISATCSIGIKTENSVSTSEMMLMWASESHASKSPGPVSSVSAELGTRNAAATTAISLSSIFLGPLWWSPSSVVQKHGFRVQAIDVLSGEHLRAEGCLPFSARSREGVPRYHAIQHPLIDNHRYNLEERGDPHYELLQVSHESIGRADVVDARERKPHVSAYRLQGSVHH